MECVLDVAVVPKPDSRAGEAPKAFVRLQPSSTLTAQELITFVEERVAPHKRVREIEFVDAIPRSLSGKILRRELIERVREREDRK